MATPKPTAEIRSSRFVISPEKAESLRKQKGLPSIASLLPSLLPFAGDLSIPAISGFRVGAAAAGISGQIYLGANIEFPGVPLHHSIHAEQFLIANALLQSEPSIPSIAVSSFPCGHCRQFLHEIRSAHQIQILVTPNSDFKPLSSFLPNPFGPSDLLPDNIPFLLEKHFNGLIEIGGGSGPSDLREAAIKAANESHAPYSESPSGFAVEDGEGRVYAGSYAESAAYNPSLGPVQAALVAYLVAGEVAGDDAGEGRRWEGIVAGVLAEREGAAVSQEETARVLFSKVAPNARFGVCRLRVETGPV